MNYRKSSCNGTGGGSYSNSSAMELIIKLLYSTV